MAWIACYASYSINGVAALHTEIIKRDTLKEWYAIWPERFNNKTNGVTPRRWLKQCNPRLAALLDEVTGLDAWVRDLTELSKFTEAGTDDVLKRLGEIKHANKADFAAWIKDREGVEIDPDSIFDVQIKARKYKRQLLNAFYVLDQVSWKNSDLDAGHPQPRVHLRREGWPPATSAPRPSSSSTPSRSW